jgi:hypothetical protein
MDRLLLRRSLTLAGSGSYSGNALLLVQSSKRWVHLSSGSPGMIRSTRAATLATGISIGGSHAGSFPAAVTTNNSTTARGLGNHLTLNSRRFRGSLPARLIQTSPLDKESATTEPTGTGFQHSLAFGVFKTFAYFILFDIVQWVVLSVYIWFTRPASTYESPLAAGSNVGDSNTKPGSSLPDKNVKPGAAGKKGALALELCGNVADRKAAFVYSWIAFAGGPERFHWILEPLPVEEVDDRSKGKLPSGGKPATPTVDPNADIELKRSLVKFFSFGSRPGWTNFAECFILAGAVVDRFGWYVTLPVVIAYRPWRPKVVKKIAQASALGY